MASTQKTVIVTGASQGIGAAVVRAFLERGYNVVGTSRNATTSAELKASDKLALVDGDIGQETTAREAVNTAIQKFGTVDAIVNNAGIFLAKPFTDYSAADFSALVSTNLEGYIYITQFAVKQMLAQKSGGSVVGITSSLVENPIGGLPVSLPMITKGGLEAITRSLASEYSKEHIRFNAVAPGVVDTPLHKNNPKDFLKTLSPMGTISTAEDIASAVVYLTESHKYYWGGAARGRRCAQWQMVGPGGSHPVNAEQRLQDLGIVLPNAPHPLGAYVEAVQTGNLLFLSGTLPIKDGKPQYIGRLGKELDADAGRDALRTATLNALSAARAHVESLNRMTRVVSVKVYLAIEGDFYNQPIVADAASELLRDVFGEDKMSVRSVLGVTALPLGAPVMLEVTFEVSD